MTHRKPRYLLPLLVLLSVSLLTGCTATATQVEQTTTTTPETTTTVAATGTQPLAASVKNADLKTDWDDATATKITLGGTSATVSGAGATAEGSVVTITTAGTFVVSGTLTNGQIVINATKDEKVHLILNGASIANATGAAIYAFSCDKLIVTLAEGTNNTLTDGGASYQYADTANEEPNAALFSKDDLTINGTGSLTVNAGYNNGIGTKDDLLIVSGTITVTAANHGLRGNESITIVDGNIQITAGNDGMQTNNTEEADKGFILIEGGTIAITSAHDGIQTDTVLSVTGGTLNVTAGGGVKKAQTVTSAETESDSYKGLKSTNDIYITGGTVTVDSYDDSVHSNGTITISGGNLTLSTGDDGVHADNTLNVSGGTVTVLQSYEGLESATINISGGDINVVASDDGINAAGGSDGNTAGGMFGKDNFASRGSYIINITGGNVYVVAGSDGLDSNGTINMSGGTVVALSTRNGNGGDGAIDADSDSAVTVTGGTLIYGGGNTMNNPGGTGSQSYAYFSSSFQAGSEVTLMQNGQVLASFVPTVSCSVIAFSTSSIVSGQTYELYVNGSQVATTTAGTGGGGGMGGGMGGGRGGFGGFPDGTTNGTTDNQNPGGQNPGGNRGGMRP